MTCEFCKEPMSAPAVDCDQRDHCDGCRRECPNCRRVMRDER